MKLLFILKQVVSSDPNCLQLSVSVTGCLSSYMVLLMYMQLVQSLTPPSPLTAGTTFQPLVKDKHV